MDAQTPTATEPAVTYTGILAFLGALGTLTLALMHWGKIEIPVEVQLAVGGVVVTGGPLVVGWMIRKRSMPTARVVEYDDGHGTVRAGEGSELTTGLPIREAGSLDSEYTDIGGYDGLADEPRRSAE